MKNIIIEFTLNGHKNTYFRRMDMYNKPLTTNIKQNARKVNNKNATNIINNIIKEYGENNVKDIKLIKDGEQ